MKRDTKVLLAYLVVCIVWGSTYLAIRIGVSELPPGLFAGIRFLIAGMIMITYGKVKKLKFPDRLEDIKKLSIVGLFLLLGGNGLVVWAEQWVHSGIASLFIATVPLFMAIIELILPNGRKLKVKGWIGLLIGFGGVVFLVFSKASNAMVIDIKGALILLLGAFLWASGSVYSKTFSSSGSMVSHIGIQMLAGGMGLTIAGALLGEFTKMHFNLKGIGAMVYLILFGSVLAYSCYVYVLKNWPAAKAGTYAYVNPPVAVLLGAMVLDEPLSVKVVISAVIILLGVILVQSSKVDEADSQKKIKGDKLEAVSTKEN